MGAAADVVRRAAEDVNPDLEKDHGVSLRVVLGASMAVPGLGQYPQAVVNRQLEYDIYIGLLGARFGTPTKSAGSGTEEEFNQAVERHRVDATSVRVLFYFKKGVVDISTIDPQQLAHVQKFRTTIAEGGCLYGSFDNEQNFFTIVRGHLRDLIREQWTDSGWAINTPPSPPLTAAPARASASIDAAGTALSGFDEGDVEGDDIGLFDLVEEAELRMDAATRVIGALGQTTEELGTKMGEHTEAIGALGRDASTSAKKGAINAAAQDLDTFSVSINRERAEFEAEFLGALTAFARALALRESDAEMEGDEEEKEKLRNSFSELRVSMSQSSDSLSEMRDIIASHPRLTTRYNRARKRGVEALDLLLAALSVSLSKLAELENRPA